MLARVLKHPPLSAACLAVAVFWYPMLAWMLGFPPFRALDFGMAFNSMAEHLLTGRFDVDPDAIGAEGFDMDGRTVAYFGIFCALLRIPLVLTPGLAQTDVTGLSCLVALCLAAWFQVKAILLAAAHGPPFISAMGGSRRGWLAAGLLACAMLGGPHIPFLRPSLYQEPIDWGLAEAMGFVFLATRGLTTPRGFDRNTLSLMALCAGLALLTRVSFGVGLYAALGLLLLVRVPPRAWPGPVTILLVCVALTGLVNHGRWGNPLVFADYTRFNLSQDAYPDRLGRLAAYGAFHPARFWLGMGYYFVPLWVWVRGDGHTLFAELQAPLMDAMELPPGSFLLSDPLLLGLAAMGMIAIRDRARAALLLGLCVPPLLMLCAISMAHRYRMEFYPFLTLAALFALGSASTARAASPRFRATIIACVAIGITAAHAMSVLYAYAPWGPGEFYLERYGIIGTWTRTPR